jgi:DNA sulfur modification protein DndB
MKKFPKNWKKKLSFLEKIDWSRGNAKLWEGRAMVGGRISKTGNNVTLTINALKSALGLPLEEEEERIEEAYRKGRL